MASSPAQSNDLIIPSLRGGQNDTDPLVSLQQDECAVAQNVEFFTSALGERRRGCIPLNIAGSGLDSGGASSVVVHLSEWFPTNDPTLPEWWAVSAVVGSSVNVARRDTAKVWHAITPDDAITNTAPNIYKIVSKPLASLANLFFFAYPSAVDRLHVWDGTNLRRTGLAQPAAPAVANTGVGTYASTRYFRVRYTAQDGSGNTLRRSEPSNSTTFTPSGSGSGALITQPALLNERETHWEVEASEDNATFYRIATLAVATTTYTDTTAYSTGYSGGTLSEVIGLYVTQPAAKFIAVDSDRLLLGGHFTDTSRASTIWWTPVYQDPGVGNAERLPITVTNSIRLDNGDGGPLTGITSSINGIWYAFKWNRIYSLVRTNSSTQAYQVITLTTKKGALPGSIFEGLDETGQPCIYFLDPQTGPCRVSAAGVQEMTGLRTTWNRANLHAQVPAAGCYYPYKHQAHFWVAADGSNSPSLKLVSQVSEVATAQTGQVKRGWALHTGQIAKAYCAAPLTEVTVQSSVDSLSQRPCMGMAAPYYIQIGDVGNTDGGVSYSAVVTTRPFLYADILNRWGALAGSLLTAPSSTTSIKVSLIRDFGVETLTWTLTPAPVGSESLVVNRLDNLAISGAAAIQVSFSDP